MLSLIIKGGSGKTKQYTICVHTKIALAIVTYDNFVIIDANLCHVYQKISYCRD
jgi:hypothetical protein